MWDKFVDLLLAIKKFIGAFLRWMEPHVGAIVLGLGVAVVVALAWMWYQGRPAEQFTLLTGPSGGAGERLGKTVASRVRKPEFSELYGRKIDILVEPTQGYEDNRQQIDRDQTGTLFGFAHDGFGPPGNVKILLPLDESYVHIMVSKDLWDKAKAYQAQLENRNGIAAFLGQMFPAPERPRTFGIIAKYLRDAPEGSDQFRHSAFLGPALSGTRQTAEMILRHNSVQISDIDSEANFDWQDMKFAMFSGRIHLAFMTTTPGSETVEKIAQRGGFYLLGLDDVAGIRTRNSHIAEAEFGKNSYGIAGREDPFCSTALKTIATRRVIICSKNMPANDAYYLATQIKEAIREQVPSINWARTVTDAQRSESQGYTFPLHPGSEPLRANYKPFYARIPGPFWPTIIIIALSLSASMLRRLLKYIDPETAQAELAPEPVDEVYAKLRSEVEELSATSTEISQTDYRRWQARVREIRKQITRRVSQPNVEEQTRELLFQGLGELECELQLRNPTRTREPEQTATSGR